MGPKKISLSMFKSKPPLTSLKSVWHETAEDETIWVWTIWCTTSTQTTVISYWVIGLYSIFFFSFGKLKTLHDLCHNPLLCASVIKKTSAAAAHLLLCWGLGPCPPGAHAHFTDTYNSPISTTHYIEGLWSFVVCFLIKCDKVQQTRIELQEIKGRISKPVALWLV